MSYQRPTGNRKQHKEFTIGTHEAQIKKISLKRTKTEKEMFSILLVGNEEQSGFYNLVFGTDYSEDNLNYILASIEDNGVSIPALDYGYNAETASFLEGKDVYIEVVSEDYQDKMQAKIKSFLTQEEFESLEETSEEEEWD